ncbi:MAG: hypothetical protein QOE94_4004 [Mycobacterium sp.]|nr:hypothetical protein [Mycobacterium sp.]
MNNALDAIPDEARMLIVEELQRRNPALLAELRTTDKPTNEQSDAIVNALSYALSANYGPGHMPNDYGRAVERAIDAYLEVWPVYR